MLSERKITEIYCMADDFCKFFEETVKKHSFQKWMKAEGYEIQPGVLEY